MHNFHKQKIYNLMMKKHNIAVVGATGLVGQKIVEVLSEREIDANLFLFAEHDTNTKMKFRGQSLDVMALKFSDLDSLKLDFAFFAVDAKVSREIMPEFVKRKIVVIDNSNAFRREKDVPLVVPQVNPEVLKGAKRIIANPNCSTIQLVTVLKPLDDKLKIKRVVVSTYQAVSGAGTNGILDLENDTTQKFDYKIKNNLIPQIDVFLPNGNTLEEDKLIFETRKILSHWDVGISATTVRVPVKNCHSESVNVQFEKPATLQEIAKILSEAENIVLQDDPAQKKFPMPLFCSGRDEVFVGRIRKDESEENCFNFWIVADNLRRGAASNSVDIFEKWVEINEKSDI